MIHVYFFILRVISQICVCSLAQSKNTAILAISFPQVPYMLWLSSVVGEWWRGALNCPQVWTCWQQLAYSTTFNSNTDTLCYNSGLEALARQACHCTPILLTNGWVHRTHSPEWWIGPLYGIGDAAAGLGVHPGVCMWYWKLEAGGNFICLCKARRRNVHGTSALNRLKWDIWKKVLWNARW